MSQEYIDLLLKDLAARVPYGVMVEQTLFPPPLADKEQRLKSVQANNVVQLYWYKYINEFVPIHCIKPYLRPMSSMTEDELYEVQEILGKGVEIREDFILSVDSSINSFTYLELVAVFNWFNAHHFDYMGLIKKGLALEAPEGMYE